MHRQRLNSNNSSNRYEHRHDSRSDVDALRQLSIYPYNHNSRFIDNTSAFPVAFICTNYYRDNDYPLTYGNNDDAAIDIPQWCDHRANDHYNVYSHS